MPSALTFPTVFKQKLFYVLRVNSVLQTRMRGGVCWRSEGNRVAAARWQTETVGSEGWRKLYDRAYYYFIPLPFLVVVIAVVVVGVAVAVAVSVVVW